MWIYCTSLTEANKLVVGEYVFLRSLSSDDFFSYVLRVTIRGRGLIGSPSKDFPFWVRNYETSIVEDAQHIKMEVGIEECLHIEFEYERSWYHLKDMVVGRINFLLVRIKLKYMEIELRRRETAIVGANPRNETEVIGKYEIMDGAPVKGETVPIRYLQKTLIKPSFCS